ncbi:MAG: 30S ribosomal protein S7 [Gammaproteobacteria bacterium]
MSRRKAATKRTILPDPLFGSELIAQFVNCVMKSGKKSIAEKIVYGALQKIVERSKGRSEGDGGKEGEGSAGGGTSSGDAGLIMVSATARELALKTLESALENVQPVVEVKSRRVGGSTYQVPVEIRPGRRVALGLRWLVEAADQRGEKVVERSKKTMALHLANEILDAKQGRGSAVKKREDVTKMAKANQAFAHYRW